jgi:methyl-accepting chemotaxis protein
MTPKRSNLTRSHITGPDKLFIAILWALLALSVTLAIWHDALALTLTIGTLLAVIPTVLCVVAPGKFGPRVAVAVALMLFCALNIYQTHGMTELHFGIFVLLAFLVCYQDWRIIVAAAATAAVHHLTFNFLQEWGYPTFCFTHPGLGIVLIHAAYVVVEAGVLSYLAIRLQRETATVTNTSQALQRTLATMRDSANVVANEMLLITEASNAVSANGTDLSRRATTQASSLGDAASAIDHLTTTVKRNVDHADDANRLVSLASAAATHGGVVVAEVVQTMDAIHSSSR